MISTSRAKVIVLVVCGLLGLVWCGFIRLAKATNPIANTVEANGEDDDPPDTGAPVQQQRIEAFIKQIGEYKSFDDAVAGLLDRPGGPKAFDIVFAVGVQSDGLPTTPETTFLQAIADRRTARMVEFLRHEPPDVAAQKCVSLFQTQLSAHRRQWEQQLVVASAGGLGEDAIRNRQGMPLLVRYTRHATCVSLVLCGIFCPPQTTLDLVSEWHRELSSIRTAIESDPAMQTRCSFDYLMEGEPEPLFEFNLMCLILDVHRSGMSEETLQTLPGDLPLLLTLEKQPLCRWDSRTNPFDFTAVHRGVKVDAKGSLLQIRFRRNWNGLEFHKPSQAVVLDHMRQAVSGL